MSLQIRRGLSTQLANITPVIGELIYTTDTQVVYVGDGSTQGGIPVAVGGSGNVSGTNLLTLGIVSAAGNVTGGNILTNGQVSAAGNVSADYFIGNGAGLTGLVASVNANSLTGTVLNSNVVTSSLTSFGTLTSLSVLGNVRTGNAVVLGEISAAGNITGGNVSAATYTGVRVSVAGNITGGNISTAGTISATGVINTAGNIVGANLNTLGQVSATGNIIGAYFTGDGSGLANVIASANTLVGSYLSSNVVNSSLTSFGTLTSLSVSGNVAAGNVSGTLTTASQNNITSVGTLNSLSVTANILGGNLNTGGQVSATGNVRGNYLRATLDINAGGNITGVNFTGAGVSVTGNITGGNISTAGALSTGNLNITGTITGNILTSGIVSAAGNVTGGNILTGGTISATGNITGGNVTLSDVGTLRIGNLTITATTIDSTEHQITLGSAGNVGNIIIAGNLQVLGNTTTINSNTVSTNDLTLNLANNAINSAAANGGGIEVGPVGSPFITWLYNSTANTWNTAGGISATGNVTGGGFVGTVYTNSIVNTGSNSTGNIGSASTYFNTVFANATSAQYADLAENYVADADYAAGTVVVFGGEKEITVSTTPGDERVAGAISTQPAHLMNAGQPGLPVALRGKVPVRVIGPVTKGDSLVTSTTPGVAQSVGRERVYAQAVFAKSLETNSADGEKVIIAVIL
jgi:hypothetical protein